ncbi:MAG: hypothetical protein ACK5RC_09830 [Curvibacter sp.]|jgi:hypothetical protein|nr:hypothetical protein [Curvibacter sp.]
MQQYTLAPLNADAWRVLAPDGAHVGNLKRVGAVWKFKAIGYEANGQLVPGGGPLTGQHNAMLPHPDALALNAVLHEP